VDASALSTFFTKLGSRHPVAAFRRALVISSC
jgi:hypothetical protein